MNRTEQETGVKLFLPSKGGQTAILVRWSAAQRTTEMLAVQRTGKNSGPVPADQRQRTTETELPLVR
jgi:hypothetical protein